MFNQCESRDAIEPCVGDVCIQHNPEVADEKAPSIECRAGIPEREFISNGLLPKVTLWYFSVINNGHKTLNMHGSTFFDSTIMEKSSSIGMFCKSSQRNQLTQIPCFSFGSRSPLAISISYDTGEFGGFRLLY